ncbi:MAG TPA: hypothetical protein EYP63_06295 [Desulfotomaculum sp.]|nr:hypothetical protein [Desulfotomaculum sp.]
MKKALQRTFLLAVALIVATTVPAGLAHAYLSVQDYYAQWEEYGIQYNRFYSGSIMNPGPVQPAPAQRSGAVTDRTPVFHLTRADYYARILNSRFYSPSPSSGYTQVTPQDEGGAGTAPAPSTQNDTGEAGALTPDEKVLFDLANQERVKAGLPPFTLDVRLVKLARLKSRDMYENNYFGHVSPTYGSAYDMERDAGISARVMGAENIARCATVERAHALFMESAGHRANILDPRHDLIGIGVVSTPYGVYVTQLFLGD